MSNQWNCNLCQKSLNSVEQYIEHEKGQLHLTKVKRLEEQNKTGADDTTSSFFIKSSDYPNDVSSVRASPGQPITPDASLNQRPAPLATAFNDLNIPLSMDKSSNLETNRENEFFFDESAKRGWCKICNINLSSKQTALDHLRSFGHQKKKKGMNEILPGLALSSGQDAATFSDVSQDLEKTPTSPPKNGNAQGLNSNVPPCDLCNVTFTCDLDREKHLDGQKHQKEVRKKECMRELERQNLESDEMGQTKKKAIFDKDNEQTYRKGTLPTYDGLASQNQTQVKVSPCGKPRAVVYPQHVTLPTSRTTVQSGGSAPENNPDVVIPNAACQGTRNAGEYCEVCHIPLTSPEHAAEHYSGQKHRKKVDRLQGQPHDDDSKKVTVSLNLKVEL